MKKQNVFYVGIKNNVDIRRNLLEASKDLVELMRGYEKIAELKEKRIEKTKQLKGFSRDIAKLCGQLKLALPSIEETEKASEKTQLRSAKIIPEQREVTRQKLNADRQSRKTFSEVKKLEKELMDIENKLKRISNV